MAVKDSMLMMSHCKDFWDRWEYSSFPQLAIVSDSGDHQNLPFWLGPLWFKNKKILVITHGFNNRVDEILSLFFAYKQGVTAVASENFKYDFVIGYIWPACEGRIYYPLAKKKAISLGQRLKRELKFLFLTSKVDVLAHSMGSRLFCEALKTEDTFRIRYAFLLAPALDADAFEEKKRFFCLWKKCERIFVFYSRNDGLLRWGYPVGELHFPTALGYWGPINRKDLPHNVGFINATALIPAHNTYEKRLEFFRCFENLLPYYPQHWDLDAQGMLHSQSIAEKIEQNPLRFQKMAILGMMIFSYLIFRSLSNRNF